MRLFDEIVAAPTRIANSDRVGAGERLTAVAAKAGAIADCHLRYVIDEQASAQCFQLIRDRVAMLDLASDLFRLPAERFWVEWLGEAPGEGAWAQKLGALVECEAGGRRGRITSFWRAREGQPDVADGTTLFDLDNALPNPQELPSCFRLRHGSLTHLETLFAHSLFRLDPAVYFGCPEAARPRKTREVAEAVWHNLPFVLAFSAVLNSEAIVEERPSNLARLNHARAKRGRAPLLDHVEIALKLSRFCHDRSANMGEARTAPRLHLVRGHLVRRQGKSFWRASHFRGDAQRPILTKTVNVCS